ncbi:hypothetical protein TKK_0017594 [Trichogramma kaykai]
MGWSRKKNPTQTLRRGQRGRVGQTVRDGHVRFRGPRVNSPSFPTLVHRIMAALFPLVSDEPALPPPHRAGEIVPAVTLEELQGAHKRIKEHTAPGPDGVPNSAIKIAIAAHPDISLRMYTACLIRVIKKFVCQQM